MVSNDPCKVPAFFTDLVQFFLAWCLLFRQITGKQFVLPDGLVLHVYDRCYGFSAGLVWNIQFHDRCRSSINRSLTQECWGTKGTPQGDGSVAHIDLSEVYVYHLITCPYYALSVQVKKLKDPEVRFWEVNV